MTNYQLARIALLTAVASLAPIPLVAQSNPLSSPAAQSQSSMPPSSTTPMQDSVGAPNETPQQLRDRMFLRKAAAGGLAEVQLGKLATEKGSAQPVRDFGQKMVDDHTKLNGELAPLADAAGVMIPKKLSKNDQSEFDKLSGLAGDAFDKEYIAFMVKDHHEDLREFHMEAMSTTDPELKAAVDKGAHVIREHMILADKLARDNGIPVPERGHKPATPPTP